MTEFPHDASYSATYRRVDYHLKEPQLSFDNPATPPMLPRGT